MTLNRGQSRRAGAGKAGDGSWPQFITMLLSAETMIRPFRGVHPQIHPTAYVDPSAQVIGDVHLGEIECIKKSLASRYRRSQG